MFFAVTDAVGHPRVKPSIVCATLTLTLLLGEVSLRAQQASRLTLQSALELAEKQNLELAAARQRRAVALAGIRIARQRPNPTFSFTALRDEPHEGWFFDQPVELGGKRAHRVELADQEGRLTDVEIATLTRQIRRRTREAFYSLAHARAESQRLNHVLTLARRLQQIAQERFEAGAVAQLEVIQAGLEVARAEADFKVAQQRERVALSELNTLLNEPASTPRELAESLFELPPGVSLPDLIQLAYQANPELQHLAQEQKVEESHRGLLRAERVPNLDLQYGLDFNSPRDFRVGPRSQLSLVLPIFSRNQGEIAQSLANQRVLESEEAATKRTVAGQVEAAYLDLDAQRTQAETYGQTVLPAARRLESMSEDSYRSGKADILVVLTAQRNVQDAERDYLDSLFSVQRSFAGLEETVGASIDQK
jgi:outer membrane protein, heavy metal efflux system